MGVLGAKRHAGNGPRREVLDDAVAKLRPIHVAVERVVLAQHLNGFLQPFCPTFNNGTIGRTARDGRCHVTNRCGLCFTAEHVQVEHRTSRIKRANQRAERIDDGIDVVVLKTQTLLGELFLQGIAHLTDAERDPHAAGCGRTTDRCRKPERRCRPDALPHRVSRVELQVVGERGRLWIECEDFRLLRGRHVLLEALGDRLDLARDLAGHLAVFGAEVL